MQFGEFVQNEFGDVFFADINAQSFSHQSANTLFERYVFPRLESKERVYLIIGTDSGLLANAIEARFADDLGSRQFIFIEHPSLLAHFGDLNFPSWLRVVSSETDIMTFLEKEYLEAIADDKLVLIDSIALIDGYDVYREIKKTFLENLTAYNYCRGARINIANFNRAILRNLPFNIFPLEAYQGALSGMTAVIIGAGPSLDDSIEWIQKNKQNLVVFAVARVAKRLRDANIQVHFFLSLDPTLDSFFNSREMLKTDYQSILINNNHVNPSLLSQWQGHSIYFDPLYPWLQKDAGTIMSIGNTVTHFALGAAVILGAKSIYLAGVDMCYKGSKTHVSGSNENVVGKYYINQRSSIVTYSGEFAETSLTFDRGRDHLANQVAFCHRYINHPVCFYNLSADAAFVEGIHLWEINNNIQQENFFSVNEAYQRLWNKTSASLNDEKKHVNQVIKTVQATRMVFSQARKLAQEGVKLAKLANSVSFSQYDKLYKIERKLIVPLTEYNDFLNAVGFLFFERLGILEHNFQKENKSLQDLSLDDLSLFYVTKFEAFLEATHASLELIDEGLQNIQKYKQFLDAKLSLDKLSQWWLSEGIPGMVYRWEGYFPQSAVLKENQDLILDLKKVYVFLLNEAKGDQLDSFKKQAHNISYLMSELERTLLNRDLVELTDLQLALNNALTDDRDKAHLDSLFHGLTDLLRDKPEQAFIHLRHLVFEAPEVNRFIHKEKLKLALQFNDEEMIVLCYEVLSQLSSEFIPAFANYWLIVKEPEKARLLLQDWVLLAPQDFDAQLKLLHALLMLADIAQARLLLNHLKAHFDQNPDLTQIEVQLKQLEVLNG